MIGLSRRYCKKRKDKLSRCLTEARRGPYAVQRLLRYHIPLSRHTLLGIFRSPISYSKRFPNQQKDHPVLREVKTEGIVAICMAHQHSGGFPPSFNASHHQVHEVVGDFGAASDGCTQHRPYEVHSWSLPRLV